VKASAPVRGCDITEKEQSMGNIWATRVRETDFEHLLGDRMSNRPEGINT
jgi:hypothetical protein